MVTLLGARVINQRALFFTSIGLTLSFKMEGIPSIDPFPVFVTLLLSIYGCYSLNTLSDSDSSSSHRFLNPFQYLGTW